MLGDVKLIICHFQFYAVRVGKEHSVVSISIVRIFLRGVKDVGIFFKYKLIDTVYGLR